MKNKKFLVTGGAGFIGSHIVKALRKKGNEVIVFDLKVGNNDVRDLDRLIKISKGVDGVFHLAAIVSIPYSINNPSETFLTNVTGTFNVLEAARVNKIKRVVFSSSSAVYGEQKKFPAKEDHPCLPKNPYALQKYMSEALCKMYSDLYNVETICLRYFNVFGLGQSSEGAYAGVIPKFLSLKKENKVLTVTGDGKQTRDFVHVEDVANANIQAMKAPSSLSGNCFNIGSGKEISVNDIVDIFQCEKTHIEARAETRRSLSDYGKAKKHLKWHPKIDFRKGLLKIIKSI